MWNRAKLHRQGPGGRSDGPSRANDSVMSPDVGVPAASGIGRGSASASVGTIRALHLAAGARIPL